MPPALPLSRLPTYACPTSVASPGREGCVDPTPEIATSPTPSTRSMSTRSSVTEPVIVGGGTGKPPVYV